MASKYDDISASWTHEIGADKLYRTFQEKLGLECSPAFQALRRVHFDNTGNAIAGLVNYEAKLSSSFFIDPTRLNAMFQLCFPATRSIDESEIMVPTHIGRQWVPFSSSSQHYNYQNEKDVHATSKNALLCSAIFIIRAIETSTERVIAKVDGVQLTSISNMSEKVKTLADANYVCGHRDWRVDLDTLDREDIRRFCEEARLVRPAPKQRFQAITNAYLSLRRNNKRFQFRASSRRMPELYRP